MVLEKEGLHYSIRFVFMCTVLLAKALEFMSDPGWSLFESGFLLANF
jgi:hypothetical protein